jgi:hypothetical protein
LLADLGRFFREDDGVSALSRSSSSLASLLSSLPLSSAWLTPIKIVSSANLTAVFPLADAPKTFGAQSVKAARADRALINLDDSFSMDGSVIRVGDVRAFNKGERAFSAFSRDPSREAVFSLLLGLSKRANV